MKMTKKAFSIVLALVMLVNVFAVMASALAPDTAVDLYIKADKEVYAPGDEIVLTFSEQVIAEVGAMTIGGFYTVGYDSAVVQPYNATSNTLEDHGFSAIAAGYDSTMSTISFNDNNAAQGDYIDDSQAAYGWDETIMYGLATDGTTFDATTKTDLFTVKMKIAEDAAFGTYTIGLNAGAYLAYVSYMQDATNGGIWGNTTDDSIYGTTLNYSFGTCTFTVGAAAPELAVTALANQIRYNKNDDGSFKDINVRARASINAAELQALVGATANDDVERKIVDAGFVFGPTLDLATAKTVAEGATVEGYTKKPVEYIQNDGTSYIYTCLVDGLTDDKIVAENDFDVLAYIALDIDGTTYYFYFEGVKDVSPVGMYNATYERANTTYGWSLAAK